MQKVRTALEHRAGVIRKTHRLTPLEAAWCALWLSGAREEKIPELAERMAAQHRKKGGIS